MSIVKVLRAYQSRCACERCRSHFGLGHLHGPCFAVFSDRLRFENGYSSMAMRWAVLLSAAPDMEGEESAMEMLANSYLAKSRVSCGCDLEGSATLHMHRSAAPASLTASHPREAYLRGLASLSLSGLSDL